ncbi:MAG: AAA family ATPase, partial [Bacteroidales bacterium]|nr:AAA family ATPase [Bacteroidales bacterium]
METLRLYPIGVQSFEKVIEEEFLYVDKTQYIVKFLQKKYNYVFLSRPRRFGKSLFVSTLKAYFEGRKELFKGLAVSDYEKEWVKYPVLHFSLAGAKHKSKEELQSFLSALLADYEKIYGRDENKILISQRFQNLISAAFNQTGQKVVILIDEYDAPLLDVAVDNEKLSDLRQIMRDFYSPLKDADPYLKFCFITGITKFSQLSIFSELNNLLNISFDDDFSGICGVTHNEFSTQLKTDVENFANFNKISFDRAVKKLKQTYDSYKFSAFGEYVFNPFSLLTCFLKNKVRFYWYETGTPTYIAEHLHKFNIKPTDISGKIRLSLNEFDISIEQA